MTSAAAKGWSLVERNVAMTDYRFVMGLLVQGYAYRQIEAMAGCSHRAIARARRVLDEEGFTTREQVDGLSLENIDRLFTDGRKSVVDEFVPVDIDKVVTARLGRNKPPLKVLWARYLESDAPAGAPPTVIVRNINRSVHAGQRIGILGANGQGKSTLVKTIARTLAPVSGEITEGKGLNIGYFAQQELDVLRPEDTPMEHMIRLAKDTIAAGKSGWVAGREQDLRGNL